MAQPGPLQQRVCEPSPSEAVKPLGEGDKAISASTTWHIRALLRSMAPKRAISGSKTAEFQSLPLAASLVIWILNC